MNEKKITIRYKNHRGETSDREVIPVRIFFGQTRYHPENQWFLSALDCAKDEQRDFAMVDILKIGKDE